MGENVFAPVLSFFLGVEGEGVAPAEEWVEGGGEEEVDRLTYWCERSD